MLNLFKYSGTVVSAQSPKAEEDFESLLIFFDQSPFRAMVTKMKAPSWEIINNDIAGAKFSY